MQGIGKRGARPTQPKGRAGGVKPPGTMRLKTLGRAAVSDYSRMFNQHVVVGEEHLSIANGIQLPLLKLLDHEHAKIRALTETFLTHLDLPDGPEGQVVANDPGYQCIAEMLSYKDVEVQKYAMWSLSVMAASGEGNHDSIITDIGWPRILTNAKSPNPDVREAAISLISNLSGNEALHDDLRHERVIPMFKNIAKEDDIKLQRAVCNGFANITANKDMIPDVVSDGGLEQIIKFSESDDEELKAAALHALANICNEDADARKKVAASALVPKLGRLMMHENEMISSGAIGVVRALMKDPSLHEQLMKLGLLDGLCKVGLTTNDPLTQFHVASAFNNMLTANPALKNVIKDKAKRPLERLARDGDDNTRKEAIAALKALGFNTSEFTMSPAEREAAARAAEDEARRKAAEEEARRKAEEDARRKAEEEARRKAAEEAKRKAEEEARRRAEEDARRKAAEDEARRKAAEEEARLAREEEARRAAERQRESAARALAKEKELEAKRAAEAARSQKEREEAARLAAIKEAAARERELAARLEAEREAAAREAEAARIAKLGVNHWKDPKQSEWRHSIFDELNFVRTNPKGYARELEKMRNQFEGLDFNINDVRCIETDEGVAALDDAIRYLNNAKPVAPFKLSEGMSRSCYDLCEERCASAKASDSGDRWDRYGQWKGKISEVICYRVQDARETVSQWIMDDGNLDRLNRNYILDDKHNAVGVAWSPHPEKKCMVVVQFAGDFIDSNSIGEQKSSQEISGQYENCGSHIVIVSEKMTGTDPRELDLVARGKSLNLTNVSSKTTSHDINCRWQLPVSFDPRDVDAYFVQNDSRVYIHVPKQASSGAQFPSIHEEVYIDINVRRS